MARAAARLEVAVVVLMMPLFMFPRMGVTPWLMALVPLLWLARWVGTGRLTVRTGLDGPLVVVALMLPVSAYATYDVGRSFPKLSGVFFGLVLFYAVVNGVRGERGLRVATGLLLAGGVAVAGLSVVGTDWSASKVPLLSPLSRALYPRLPALVRGVPRAETGFHPNQVGGTLTLFVPLAAALLLHRLRHRRWELGWVLPTVGLAATLGLTGSVAVLTQSRMTWFGLAVSLGAVGVIWGRWTRVLVVVAVVGLVALVAVRGVAWVTQPFGLRVTATLGERITWAGRVEIWRRAVRVIRDHPLTGIGFDTLFPVIHARYPTFLIRPGYDGTHAHNFFLQVALDLGLPGLLAIGWLLGAFGRMGWRVYRRAEQPGCRPAYQALALGLLGGVAAQLVYGLADAIALGQKPGVFLWAFLGVGAALWRTALGDAAADEGARESIVERVRGLATRLRRAGKHLLTKGYRPVVVGMVVLLVVGGGLRTASRGWRWASLVRADLASLEALASRGTAGGPRPGEVVAQTHRDLKRVEAEFGPVLVGASRLGWVPRYGADLAAVPRLVRMGVLLSGAGERVLEPLQPLLDARRDVGGEVVVASLEDARPRLEEALDVIRRARGVRESIPAEALSPQLARAVARLDGMLPLAEDGLRAALALPELLGAEEPRTYLVLLQNEDELRPTGGFISSVARVRVDRGRVVGLSFEDSYGVDDFSEAYPSPPPPLREIMGTELWVFRDSNWSPHFPTAARQAAALYQLTYDVEVDGVIAVDQDVVERLVGAVEPLRVEGYPEPVTRENVIAAMRETWAPDEEELTREWWRQRKDFMGRLLTSAVVKLQEDAGEVRWSGLAQGLLEALEERHAFVTLLDDSAAEATIEEAGWDGGLRRAEGDYLMVVDANLGFNKVNPLIDERMSYAVDLSDPQRPQASLVLGHSHQGAETGAPCLHESRYGLTYEAMMERCYWDYVRVYGPGGSELVEGTRHPIPADLLVTGRSRSGEVEVVGEEVGKAVFGSFFVLPPGEKTETRLSYALPSGVVEHDGGTWRYHLLVQKQGGADARPLEVTVTLPEGARVIETTPSPAGRQGGQVSFDTALRTDRELEIHFTR